MTNKILNFPKLATSNLRKQVLQIAEAGYLSIDTTVAVQENFQYNLKTETLKIEKNKFDLKKYKRIVCIGFGKAALTAVTEIQKILVSKISCGFVIDLKEGVLGNIICRVGTHPYPTTVNVKATKELVSMLEVCEQGDLVICVVSGGGSALLCDPHEMTCEQETEIIAALTVAGANIFELNTVRKHISKVKGGQLAKIIYPATCIGLIFSDVPGDELGAIASGPTVKDSTNIDDAKKILQKYQILEKLNIPNLKLVETPKEEKYFTNVHNFLLVSPKKALFAMQEKALEFGLKVKVFSDQFQGEAKKLGPEIVNLCKKGECVLGAGESTVKIVGKGLGGRNQEMVLAALPFLAENQVFASFASDGHDNTDSAGAIADLGTKLRAENLGLVPEDFLKNNDSYNFFAGVGDQVITGLTGSNVSDFFICIQSF